MANLLSILTQAAEGAVPPEVKLGSSTYQRIVNINLSCLRAGAEIALQEFLRRCSLSAREPETVGLAEELLDELPGYTPDSPPGDEASS